ncbi:primosomal protein N' [Nocardia sp. NPDC006630]|uniref:primosomal protein N' n=1 Tax=Nocardia sp. NPDC006630 TaxID=3157181 RepID=UPI0033ACAAA7
MTHTGPAAGRPIARVLPLLEPAHLDRDFDYLVPPELDEIAQPGVRVRVRFSGRLIDGYILERLEKSDHTGRLVRLDRVVSSERVLTPEILRLVTAVAARYAGTRADVLRLAIPPRHAKIEAEGENGSKKATKAAKARKTAGKRASDMAPAAASNEPVMLDEPDPEDVSPTLDASHPRTADDFVSDGPVVDAPHHSYGPRARSERVDAPSIGGLSAAAPAQVTDSGDDSSVEAESAVGESAVGESAVGESAVGESAVGESAVGESAEDEPAVGESVEDESADGESAVGESAEDAEGGSVDDESGEGESGDGESSEGGSGEGVDPALSAEVGSSGDPDGAEAVPLQAIPSEFPDWHRYEHGRSFLSALAAGQGPRAAWQALPGENWPRRLAELAAVVVSSGRSAVLMVPDQRDLDRVLAECTELVGDSAVALAAGLGPSARYRRWLAALRGTARIVVGTRASVFTPMQDLGLIAIWDDGDGTYAEPRSPYPHAREVAMLRAHETGAAFVAGGFARTAEVQAIVESGWAHDLLADRGVLRQVMPHISAPGDSDAALERDPIARAIRIPGVAFLAARKALAAGEPVLVQVPRRGYIPALACAKCRTPARCRHCNGPLALPDTTSDASRANPTAGSTPGRVARAGTTPGNAPGRAPHNGAEAEGARGRAAYDGAEARQAGYDGSTRQSAGVDGARGRPTVAGAARPPFVDRGVAMGVSVPRGGAEMAHSPACRWCGITEAAFRCGACGSRALRAVVIGAVRTAEELGRAFPGVPVRGSGGTAVLDSVPEGPQVVVSTIGAEPVVPGGYAVALLLDGWALLGRADLRAAEDALRRWMSAAALVRTGGQVLVMADPAISTVQALLRWDPVGHAQFELDERTQVRFPPSVRLAAVDGTTDSIAELLTEAKLPDTVEVLGPVPLPPGARKPFSSGDNPPEVERMILRVDRAAGAALARALSAALAVRSTHKSDAPLRVQIDPVDIG